MIEHVIACTNRARIGNDITCTIQRQNITCTQRITAVAHGDEPLKPRADLRIAALPVIGSAVEWILKALHADLIAIVDARHAGIGHLPQCRHEQAAGTEIKLLLCHAHPRLLDGRHPLIIRDTREHGDGTLHIMTANEIHHRIEVFFRVVLQLTALAPHGLSAVCVTG